MFCSSPEPLLQDIKKAKHLVELNIIGMKFDNLQQIGSLLNLLVHLSKLSFGWPRFAKPSEGVILKKSLNRIKYLTVRVDNVDLVNSFFPVLLRYSKKLEELFLLVTHFGNSTFASTYLSEDLDALQLTCLPRLKIVAGYNIDYLYIPLHELFEQILPDRERWTEFRADSYGLLYYGKSFPRRVWAVHFLQYNSNEIKSKRLVGQFILICVDSVFHVLYAIQNFSVYWECLSTSLTQKPLLNNNDNFRKRLERGTGNEVPCTRLPNWFRVRRASQVSRTRNSVD